MLRGIFILILLAAFAAGARGEDAPGVPGKDELGIAAIELERVLVTYDTDRDATSTHVDGALRQLWVWANLHGGTPREAEFISDATAYLRAVEDAAGWRRARYDSPPEDVLEEEMATIRLIADNLLLMAAGVPSDRPAISSDYEMLRAEVKANEAAGEGDIAEQIMAVKAEAARMHLKADVYEAENGDLEERAKRVQAVIDFWKTIIGEDQVKLCPWR
ncbi:MAG: hypothetical protein PVH29_09510 [Candidatus Zixiibacteriota bacterium]|jgi:hypothetical protein